jgi:hypothetical protein
MAGAQNDYFHRATSSAKRFRNDAGRNRRRLTVGTFKVQMRLRLDDVFSLRTVAAEVDDRWLHPPQLPEQVAGLHRPSGLELKLAVSTAFELALNVARLLRKSEQCCTARVRGKEQDFLLGQDSSRYFSALERSSQTGAAMHEITTGVAQLRARPSTECDRALTDRA